MLHELAEDAVVLWTDLRKGSAELGFSDVS